MDLDQARRELQYYVFKSLCNKDEFERFDLEGIKYVINSLMNNGVYYDEFLDIVHNPSLERDTFVKAFAKSCAKMDIPFPDNKEQAGLIVIRQIMTDIVEKDKEPLEGLSDVLDIYHSDLDDTLYDLRDWHAYYYSYDGTDDNGEDYNINSSRFKHERVEIEDEIVKMAKEWLKKYG